MKGKQLSMTKINTSIIISAKTGNAGYYYYLDILK